MGIDIACQLCVFLIGPTMYFARQHDRKYQMNTFPEFYLSLIVYRLKSADLEN